MSANRDLILAGIAGGGTGSSLAWFGPKGTTMPTAASGTGSTLDVAMLDAGWISEEGLRKGVDENVTDINAYGATVPVRSFVTRSKLTFGLTFLETNKVTLSVYNRYPLTGAGSLTIASGKTDFTEGAARSIQYAAVFDAVDGANKLRIVVPVLEVTERAEYNVKAGEAITYGITATAYPGSDGVAAHYYYEVAGLT